MNTGGEGRPKGDAAGSPRCYTAGEEIACSVTHGIGAALAMAGLAVVVAAAVLNGDPRHVVSATVYGVSLVLLYLASTLYHAVSLPGPKRVLKMLDHMGVYLLIAGTYTPFTLVTLRGAWGWSIFGVVWGLALLGMSLEAFWVNRPKWLSAVVCLLMGWVIVVALRPLVTSLDARGVRLLFAGGLAYSFGTIFYLWKWRYMHAVWHAWVIAGSVLHFFAILNHVMP